MPVALLHNEKAGEEDWSQRELERLVRRAGFRPKYFPLKEALRHPDRLEKADFVIVAGGDGSLRKVALKLLGRGLTLAPLPLGTANNIARSLGLHDSPEKIIRGWKHARRRRFDVGVVHGPWGAERFVEGIGIGLISRTISVLTEIDDVSAHAFKKRKHKLHRDACVAAALAHAMSAHPTTLRIDGRDASDDFLLLEILNIRRAGPAVALAPNANPSDGRFDVVTVSDRQRRRLMHALKDRLADQPHRRGLPTSRAHQVRFSLDDPSELRIDDGTVPLPARTSVRVTIEAGALEFLLPGRG